MAQEYELSEMEAMILSMQQQGYRDKEIKKMLSITFQQVSKHKSTIAVKLQLQKKTSQELKLV